MKDLMTHVERIVRPVRANQSRKLRMRRELLAHLEAALEQEREAASGEAASGEAASGEAASGEAASGEAASGEAAAVDRAKQRLGDPAELTRQLQGSVPLVERLLHARTPDRWSGWERRAAKAFGLSGQGTLGHQLILYGSGAIAVPIIWLFSPHIPPKARARFVAGRADSPASAAALVVLVWAVQVVWLYAGARFLAAAAGPAEGFRLPRAIRAAVPVLLSQALLMALILTQIVLRTPEAAEMARSLGATLLLLGLGVLVGRGVAMLRRPYDEWLTLDLSQ